MDDDKETQDFNGEVPSEKRFVMQKKSNQGHKVAVDVSIAPGDYADYEDIVQLGTTTEDWDQSDVQGYWNGLKGKKECTSTAISSLIYSYFLTE